MGWVRGCTGPGGTGRDRSALPSAARSASCGLCGDAAAPARSCRRSRATHGSQSAQLIPNPLVGEVGVPHAASVSPCVRPSAALNTCRPRDDVGGGVRLEEEMTAAGRRRLCPSSFLLALQRTFPVAVNGAPPPASPRKQMCAPRCPALLKKKKINILKSIP